jgi:hypothetical protein
MPPIVESPEDLKKGPEQPKPLRTAEEAALSRHMDNFNIAEDTDSEEVEAAAEAGDLKLPKTLKAVHALMQEILAIEPTDARAEKVKRAKLQVVRAHLFELEQGPAAPVVHMSDHKEIAAAQSAHAIAFKLGELARMHPEVKTLVEERDALKRAANIPTGDLAQKMYGAYCVAVGGKAFNGDALPAWKDFSTDEKKKTQVDAWIAAATAAKQLFGN